LFRYIFRNWYFRSKQLAMKTYSLTLLLLLCLGFYSLADGQSTAKYPQWTKTSHESNSKPSYSTVFPEGKVNRIDLVILPEDWKKLKANIEKRFGSFSTSQNMGFPPMGQMPDSASRNRGMPRGPMGMPGRGGFPGPPPGGMTRLEQPGQMPDSAFQRTGMPGDSLRMLGRSGFRGRPLGGMAHFGLPNGNDTIKGRGPGGMGPGFGNEESFWIPCSFYFEGKQWYSVGIRFKGNSSLMMSWQRGLMKLPMRFKFNKYKDSIPELDKQRFYGFKELSFSNNSNDMSLVREKLSAEIFSEAGVKAPKTAFFQVYIDYGDGPVYFGVYTAIEVVEDTMLKSQFGGDSGNVYKPEGGSFAGGTFDTSLYEKKNNKKKADFSDLKALYDVLQSSKRKDNPTQWKAELENIFDVPVFMRWLAVNNTIQNWDSYGRAAHNYCLYHNPASGKLVWIPYDNNEALDSKRMEMGSLSLSEADENWPLIRYLMDVPEYNRLYKNEIQNLISRAFNPEYIKGKLNKYQQLLKPYVVGANGEKQGFSFINSEGEFNNAFIQLEKHVKDRNEEAKKYLRLTP
jgi:spore coat protein H